MGNASSMSRENKKEQLKRRIVQNQPHEEEDSREIIHKAHRRSVRRRRAVVLVLLLLAVIAAVVFYRYDRYHRFESYQPLWERDLTSESQEAAARGEGSFTGCLDFADGVLKYTKDGVSYLDAKGKTVWVTSYEMKNPIVAVNGEYAAVADQQGNSIYICNPSGCQGQATTLLPILRVTVSAGGVAATLEEDSRASYIYFYKKNGSRLDIYVKSVLSGDGYPIDISLSPGGTQLLTSFMYLDQGMIKNKVVFYNFGLGKDDPRRVVGGFEPADLGDAMAGMVRFMDDSHAVIFTDKGLQFFSTRVETTPESVAQIMLEENVRSAACTEKYAGVVTDNSSGGDPYCLRIYRSDGTPVFDAAFSFQYTNFDIDGDLVLLYNESGCLVYNMAGTEKFNGSFDFTVTKVSKGRFPSTLLVTGPQRMMEVRLQ